MWGSFLACVIFLQSRSEPHLLRHHTLTAVLFQGELGARWLPPPHLAILLVPELVLPSSGGVIIGLVSQGPPVLAVGSAPGRLENAGAAEWLFCTTSNHFPTPGLTIRVSPHRQSPSPTLLCPAPALPTSFLPLGSSSPLGALLLGSPRARVEAWVCRASPGRPIYSHAWLPFFRPPRGRPA